MNLTCSQCRYFQRFGVEKRGYCYGFPPLVHPSGATSAPPVVNENRPGCHFFSALQSGELPEIKAKVRPDTHGDVIKAARRNGAK